MGIMKRLYEREGKGLPTDGPTVLRVPGTRVAKVKATPAPAPTPASAPESSTLERWVEDGKQIKPATQPGWWKYPDGGYVRQQDVMPEKWATMNPPPHPAEQAVEAEAVAATEEARAIEQVRFTMGSNKRDLPGQLLMF